MPDLTDAGVGERRYRRFVIKTTVAATTAVADLTGLTVILYKRRKNSSWSAGVNIDTASDPTELVIVTADAGLVELRPSATWWNEIGSFEMAFEINANPLFFAPDTDVHNVEVVDRP